MLSFLYNSKGGISKYNFILQLCLPFINSIKFFGKSDEEKAAEITADQTKEGRKMARKFGKKLQDLIPEYQRQYDEANASIEDLFGNTPQIDLSKYMSELSNISKGTTKDISKYLRQGNSYTGSMIKEGVGGADAYLTENKRIARSDMPGVDIYRDQAASSLADSIGVLRSSGGLNSSNLTSLLRGSQETQANIALQSGQFKAAARQNLANAYMNAGQYKSGLYGQAADFSQGQAGLSEMSGKFASDLTGKQASLSGIEFDINKQTPWNQELAWRQVQAQTNNPLAFAADVYGSLTGMGWAQQQSGAAGQVQAANVAAQNKVAYAQIFANLASSFSNSGRSNNNQ